MNENEFATIANEATEEMKNELMSGTEVLPDDFASDSYIKNPSVGESIELDIDMVINNPKIDMKDSEGVAFKVGLKDKNNKYVRYDIKTKDGAIYTVNSWEVFFKLFGKDSVIMQKAKLQGNFRGFKVKITRNFNGKYATETTDNIAKLEGITKENAAVLKEAVKKAKAERKLYTVELLN